MATTVAAMVLLLVHQSVSSQGMVAIIGVMVVSTVSFVVAVAQHFVRRPRRRGA